MTDRKPYWKDHPAYVAHEPLAALDHESGRWEAFCVNYRTGHQLYEGGTFLEFYWNGDHQESFPYTAVSNPKEQLEQFIDFWLDEAA